MSSASRLAYLLLAVVARPGLVAAQSDADRDGLSDFAETHKHFTDPGKADSDGDGVPDGDWDERREYAYSVRAVMHVMAPFNVAAMNDDYQDVRVLEQRPDLLEFEVVVYPYNTVAEAIEPNERWRKPSAEAKEYLRPGVCSNFDKEMQRQLESELEQAGIELGKLDDVAAAQRVSQWLLERAQFEDSFTTFAVEFEGGTPRVVSHQVGNVEQECRRRGRSLAQQWDHELFGKGMFETRTRGSCTSSAIYLSTGLRAIGIPTRTVICVPIVDANDDREVSWLDSRLTNDRVRRTLRQAVDSMRGSWASHTFNEVLVGGRWRRLNYTQLGQNVLDEEYLGLMVHVHTYGDHSEAGLSGWGSRGIHPQQETLFGGPNPYSCVSLSDRLGPHAKTANEPLAALRELEITRVYWYDDPSKDAAISTELPDPETSGYFVAHVQAGTAGSDECMEFFDAVGKDFVLRARGREDVRATAMYKYWIDPGRDINDFIFRIEPADFAKMEHGVDYELSWPGGDAPQPPPLRWKVKPGLRLARPRS